MYVVEQGWPTCGAHATSGTGSFCYSMQKIGEGAGNTAIGRAGSRKSNRLGRGHRAGGRKHSNILCQGQGYQSANLLILS